jgi:CPA1 family monovalent cation:H+ antiporter
VLNTIWVALAGLAVILAVRVAADRAGLPAAVLLVLAGLALAWLPGPTAELDPELILDVVIPPLLFAAARDASVLEMGANKRLIGSLSVALVLVTALAVGGGLALVVPGLGFAAALAIGAAVAPPDPVAALAIGRRAGLPSRLGTVIEGEGLLNDATALTLYGLAVTAATGGGFSFGEAVGRFALAVVGGVACGLLVARLVVFLRGRVDDVLVQNAASLATPFVAFALAEAVDGSGVLAVVVAGLSLGGRRGERGSGASRLQTAAVWRIVEYLLEGYVFLLIGQQAPSIVDGLAAYETGTVVAATGVSVVIVLLVRPLWLGLVRLRTSTDHVLTRREVVALSWAGTRGVITLATAFALPLDFPARDLLLFCAFVVVLVTLVGQGLTFAPLLRALRLRSNANQGVRMRIEAQAAALGAAIERLDELAPHDALGPGVAAGVRRGLVTRRQRMEQHLADAADPADHATGRARVASVRQELIDAQREELVRWRDAGRLADADLRELERRLDVQELSG